MKNQKSLHDYDWPEYPEVINEILSGEKRLIALISANEFIFFGSENEPENVRKAEFGRYEICEIDVVITALERMHDRLSDPSRDLLTGGPARLTLKQFKSPSGEVGFLGDTPWNPETLDDLSPFGIVIPFTRIVVEEALATRSNYEIQTREYAAIHAVYREFWADGKNSQKKDNIVDWIMTEFGFSKKTAEVIDTICRPENRRKGGNVKLKRP